MRPARVVALVIGCLLVIPAFAALIGGSVLGLGYLFGRDDDGYYDVTLNRLESDTAIIVTDDLHLGSEPGSPAWLIDWLDADVRMRATNADSTTGIFVGVADAADIDAYITGVAHDELIEIDNDLEPVFRSRTGELTPAVPTDQTFWVAAASGVGTRQLEWEATTGDWAAVVMNADASPGIAADVNVGVTADFIGPVAIGLLVAGTVATALAVALIIAGASGAGERAPAPRPLEDPAVPLNVGERLGQLPHPVTLEAKLDPDLSRWMWLVKWILAIPHLIVLVFLWIAFAILALVAGVSILFTGRYPRGIFDFNVGVLRWSWRVSHYASTGGIATDRYPGFSLHAEADDLATLDIAYPERLSRSLVLVKWLLAIPHLLIVGVLAGPTVRLFSSWPDGLGFEVNGGGLLGILALVAGIVLLVTDRYPAALFDLIVGLNRWIYRVVAYIALMTDDYPPFRLDQGGTDPLRPLGVPPAPSTDEVDLRHSFSSYDDERRSMT